jgi:hypothetical protein
MDWMAIASLGSYPAPSVDDDERMAFAATLGMWDDLPAGLFRRGVMGMGMCNFLGVRR